MAGRETAASSRRGQQRAQAPVNVWHRKASAIDFGRFEFRLWVRRRTAQGTYQRAVYGIDNTVQALSWGEGSDGLLTGSVTVHQDATPKFNPRVGDTVTCEWSRWGQNKWHVLWVLTLTQPQYQLSAKQWVFQLEDDLLRLKNTKDTFRFRSDRAHPHGWRVDEAIRRVCERSNVGIARIPRLATRVKKLTLIDQSPLVAIQQLLRRERTETGKRYFLRWIGGKLAVVPFQRSRFLLLVGGYIMDGTHQESQKDGFATVLEVTNVRDTGKGVDAKGRRKHKKKKLTTVVRSEAGIQRYGVVRKTVVNRDADSITDLRRFGKRELARRARPQEDFSFTHPGVPHVRLADAVRLTVPEIGYNRQIVYVSEVQHTVQPGSYTMEVTITASDPFVEKRADRVRRKRAAKARDRGRVATEESKTRPQTKKARQRGDR